MKGLLGLSAQTRTRPLLLLGGGQALSAGLTLAYGKLTALYVPPAVWGEYSLLFAGLTLAHGLLITPTIQSYKAALARFPAPSTTAAYARLLGLLYTTLMPALALAAGLYFQNPVFGLIWLAAVGQGLYQFGNESLNAAGRHRPFVLVQLAYALATLLGFGMLLLLGLTTTPTGLWLLLAGVNGLFAGLALWRLRSRQPLPRAAAAERAARWREYRHFVGPLLGLAGWNWLLNYADRYLIRYYLTDADVGQYTMGYSLGSKVLLLVAPLLALLSPRLLRMRADGLPASAANPLLLHYLIRYLLVGGLGCGLFWAGQSFFGSLLLADRYRAAFTIGPIVAVGYLSLTGIHLLELKWYTFAQTRYIRWHTIAGTVLNLALNVLLIPRLGITGAALATALGFAGQLGLVLLLFRPTQTNASA